MGAPRFSCVGRRDIPGGVRYRVERDGEAFGEVTGTDERAWGRSGWTSVRLWTARTLDGAEVPGLFETRAHAALALWREHHRSR